MAASDYADWWDQQKKESEQILTEWVQENPQWWAVGIAATVQTTMDVGAGVVDVLRFGQGFAEGGWRGLGKDALRMLVLLGPLGRAGGILSRLASTGRMRLAVQVSGVNGPCTFQAVNNALMITKGRNVFVTVRDMAGAMGKNLSKLTKTPQGKYDLGAWVDDLVPFLRQFTKVKEVQGLKKVTDIAQLAQKENGVVIFAVRATVRNAKGINQQILHSVIAVRRAGGKIAYGDYGGKLCGSLEEVISKWGTIRTLELYQKGMSAVVVDGVNLTGQLAAALAKGAVVVISGITAIESVENGLELAAPAAVAAAPIVEAEEIDTPPEVVKGSLEAFKQRKQGKKVIRLDDIYITPVKGKAPRPDWLTGVQYRLNALGFGSGRVDGVMGPITKKAVLAFQKEYPPLKADGIPGPKTQAKLVEVCGY